MYAALHSELKKYWLWFQTITIKRSSSAQGGAGNYEVITIDDDDEVIPSETKTADSRTSQMMMVTHLDQSGSRTDYLARGGSSVSHLSRGGTQTLGSSVKVESVTALRSTPQWLTATTTTLASTPSVGIILICGVSLHVTMTSGHCADSQHDGIMLKGFVFQDSKSWNILNIPYCYIILNVGELAKQ